MDGLAGFIETHVYFREKFFQFFTRTGVHVLPASCGHAPSGLYNKISGGGAPMRKLCFASADITILCGIELYLAVRLAVS